MENLINNINSSNSLDELYELKDEIHTFFTTATEDDKELIRETVINRNLIISASVNEAKRKVGMLFDELDDDIIIEKGGIRYDLAEWITPSEYAKKYSLKTAQVVNNWIARGLVKPENVLKISKLNISLVRDIENIR